MAEHDAEQALPVAPSPGETTEAAPPDAWVVEVVLRDGLSPDAPRRSTELTALVMAQLEGGLSDLFGVIARVEGAVPSPGVADPLETGRVQWTIDVAATPGVRDRVDIVLTTCDPDAHCIEDRASTIGPTSTAMGPLLARLAAPLGRTPQPGAVAGWERPQSKDPYAELLAGRAAASFYGLLPALSSDQRGDRRLDPVERAIFIDPKMSLPQWIAARRRFASGELVGARLRFAEAGVAMPQRLVFLADEAATLAAAGQQESAEETWRRVLERSPRDPRFVIPRGRALIAVKQLDRATQLLNGLPQMFQRDAKVLRLRVDIAEKRGGTRDDDELLAAWQAAAPDDPEPVRRRVAARVRAHDLGAALELVPELSRRGAADEALRLELALEVSLGQLGEAMEAARALGLTSVQAGIGLRIMLSKPPAERSFPAGDPSDALAATALAEAMLTAGDAPRALVVVDKVLAQDPWLPETLLVRSRALTALGRTDDAARAATRVALADPALALRVGLPEVRPRATPTPRPILLETKTGTTARPAVRTSTRARAAVRTSTRARAAVRTSTRT